MQVDEKARIAAADAIWNEFLYHVDTVACGDRFQTPDAAMARRISDIAIAAYLSALGEQKPIAFVSKRVIDALDVNGTEIVDAMLFPRGTLRPTEARPLYASPLPVRPITDEDVERAAKAVSDEWGKMVAEMSPHMSPGDIARSFVSPGNHRLIRAALEAASREGRG